MGILLGRADKEMRPLALLVALFIVVVGIVGVIAPDHLMAAGRYVITPVGLYAIAALRVGMGLVLMLAIGSFIAFAVAAGRRPA